MKPELQITQEPNFEQKFNAIVQSKKPYTIFCIITDCMNEKYEAEFDVNDGGLPETMLREACARAFLMCDNQPSTIHISVNYFNPQKGCLY